MPCGSAKITKTNMVSPCASSQARFFQTQNSKDLPLTKQNSFLHQELNSEGSVQEVARQEVDNLQREEGACPTL